MPLNYRDDRDLQYKNKVADLGLGSAIPRQH